MMSKDVGALHTDKTIPVLIFLNNVAALHINKTIFLFSRMLDRNAELHLAKYILVVKISE